MNTTELLLLGAIAGFTIFLGLPLAVLRNLSSRTKGFLNAIAIGILIFLIIDVFSHAWSTAGDDAISAYSGTMASIQAVPVVLAVFGGLAIGLLGLVAYESRYLRAPSLVGAAERPVTEGVSSAAGSNGIVQIQERKLVEEVSAFKLATMIAIAIGAHNFSEGLAIGQSYASGSLGLALMLIIGFGAHNATEGFGIASPLTQLQARPPVRFLAVAGLIGGGPTFLGTLAGSLVGISDFTYVLFLSIAGGALIYVSMLMYNAGRRQTTNRVLMTGIFVGVCAGLITDLIVTLGGA